jgi:WD40 repeat protein
VSGKWLAVSSSWDGTLKVWDLKNGLELRTLVGHNQRVNSVIVTHHEDLIISISADTTFKVWNIQTGQIITSFTGEAELISCSFSEISKIIIVGDVLGNLYFLQLEIL